MTGSPLDVVQWTPVKSQSRQSKRVIWMYSCIPQPGQSRCCSIDTKLFYGRIAVDHTWKWLINGSISVLTVSNEFCTRISDVLLVLINTLRVMIITS